MTRLLLGLLILISGAPVLSYDVRCRSYSRGSYTETYCTDGLWPEEQKADRQRWKKSVRTALLKAGLPANFCREKTEKLYNYRLSASSDPNEDPVFRPKTPTESDRESILFQCEMAARDGEALKWWRMNGWDLINIYGERDR